MPRNFTNTEQLVARVVSIDAMNIANDNDVEAGCYMGPVADFVLRDDLSDAAFASLGRQLFQQYLRDVMPLVLAAEREMEEAVEQAEAEVRQFIARTPNHILPRGLQ
ncbi:hypothetical protein MNJPNG_04805 [Cupriavidus oxalaticus]